MGFFHYEKRTFFLKKNLSVYKASELLNQISKNYHEEKNKEGEFFLDLSQVESMDTAILQILISLKKTVELNKGKLELKKKSEKVEELLTLLGLPKNLFSQIGLENELG